MTRKPFPYKQLAIICTCRFAEPICFTVIFPFIVQMVRDFKIGEEESVGYYVGLITSCFAFTQLLTGIQWGMLSDRIGRRPVILQGLVGTITSILLFGLSKSFLWALLSRSLCGLLNGNIGVLKSMVSELTNDLAPDQRAQAFSLLPLMYGLGTIIGPMLGGFLSHPVDNFPNAFGNLGQITDFLIKYPYFLPCFISASICTMGLIFGFFFLEETHIVNKKPVLNQTSDEEGGALLTSNNSNKNGYTTFNKAQHSPTPTINDKQYTLRDALTPPVLSICLVYSLFALQAVFMDELFPLYTASSRPNGGLGFSPNEIGSALAFSGIVTLASQMILPYLTRKFGLVRLFQITLNAVIFIYLFQGIIRTLYYIPDPNGQLDTKFWVWIGLLTSVTFKTLCHTICFTGCTILINNACPRVESLGAVNGFSQCCASGTRAIGPAICGAIWSASLSAQWIPYNVRVNIAFVVLAGLSTVTWILSKKLNPEELETATAQREEVVEPSSSS